MTLTALSDAGLLDQARDGDEAAFTELYVRHHEAARRLASTYRRVGDPEDLVNGAFERVLGALRRGAGPTESFRAYLFVTLRRLAAEQGERPADQSIDEVPEPVGNEADAPELDHADRELITRAFESLPERWQAVLWHTAVEGRQPRELAGVLGVSANAAAAMAYRAREKLRQAYLQAHLLASPAPDHEPYRSQLGAYVRDGLSKRDHDAVELHLEDCESCRDLVAELNDVNRMLVRSVLPLFLLAGYSVGGGAAVAVAAAGGAAAAGKGSGSASAPKGFVGKVKHLAPTIGSAAAIAAVVVGLAGIGTVVVRADNNVDAATEAADSSRSGDGGSGSLDIGDDAGDVGGDGLGAAVPGASDELASIFGDDPSDGPPGLFGVEGFTDYGYDPSRFIPRSNRSRVSTRPRSPAITSTPPSTPSSPTTPTNPGPPAPSPPDPTPTTPPPGPGPTPLPPPALAFTASDWTPSAIGRGQLSLIIGEASAPLIGATAFGAPASDASVLLPAAPVQAAPAPLKLQVELTPGARAFPDASQDARCSTPVPSPSGGQVIGCSLDQPAPGGTTDFSFDLQVDSAGQTATVKLFRGDALEAELPSPIALDQFEAGLSLTDPVWTPYVLPGESPRPLPLGALTVGAANLSSRSISGAAIRVTFDGESGLVPPQLFTHNVPKGLLDELPPDMLPLPDALREQIIKELTTPLPAGCTVEGYETPGEGLAWGKILKGGLPDTVVCQLGDMAPQATSSFGGLIAAIQPLYNDSAEGEDQPDEGSSVTVTLELQGHTIATRTLSLLPSDG
jgi:RNA polymerase sigma factor (sigma-70 family)